MSLPLPLTDAAFAASLRCRSEAYLLLTGVPGERVAVPEVV
jgi:hypothetical protein